MRFAFSTLGVPGMPMADVAALAADSGYQGVELRAAPDEPVHPGLSGPERRSVAREFERAGVKILAVCGYTAVAAEGDDARVLQEIGELIRLARDLGAAGVRLFPGGTADAPVGPPLDGTPGDVSTDGTTGGAAGDGTGRPGGGPDAIAARRLGRAAGAAVGAGVRLLLETHDSHPTGAAVSRVLGPVGHQGAGAVWDVLHPGWAARNRPRPMPRSRPSSAMSRSRMSRAGTTSPRSPSARGRCRWRSVWRGSPPAPG